MLKRNEDKMSEEQGLSNEEVLQERQRSGSNVMDHKEKSAVIAALEETITEPMFILLLAAGIIYFLLGETGEGIFMLAAILVVSAISFYQNSRSRNALDALKQLTQPLVKVIRSGQESAIPAQDLVKGDIIILEEGVQVPADALILKANDFAVNESVLTGEAFAVYKDELQADAIVYQGTAVVGGLAICRVTHIGNDTALGKIGHALQDIKAEKSPLQREISRFVTLMAIAGGVVFLIVWGINFYHSHDVLDSLLKGLTLAMSVLPEEIPVAFTTFVAIGAWRLMKMGIIVKQTQTVETLGSASVICTDKTGTMTEHRMQLVAIYVSATQQTLEHQEWTRETAGMLITTAMWASEPLPFDPMEKALHDAYRALTTVDERPAYNMIHEYPLGGKPPMMTHVFANKEGKRIIAAKGAPEAILQCCHLPEEERQQVMRVVENLAGKGYRLLGVAQSNFEGDHFPKQQQELPFAFIGLVAFYDPPKANIAEVFRQFYDAGIAVKIITGDSTATTLAIARQAGLKGTETALTGDELLQLSPAALQETVQQVHIFTRMFPEAKLRIINALKANQQIVAMTGDGVNDAPALKAAHIGIAMGNKGTEIAKRAAALVLADDDLSKMVDAIKMGRKIYSNLKKAIQYILSIHIPIILTVTVPLLLGWVYPNIFTPVHVIFLELIMGPTCSIVYENEPAEKNTMLQPPRPYSQTFLSLSELGISIVQGLIITAGTLCIYQYAVACGYDENLTRTMVFTTLLVANIFLMLVNRSFYYSFWVAISYNNALLRAMLVATIVMMLVILYVPAVATFFKFEQLTLSQLSIAALTGGISVIWFEGWKLYKRKWSKQSLPAEKAMID
jgi:Ca2+-transporting ATPase